MICVSKLWPDFEHVLEKKGRLQCYEERSLYRKCLLPAGPSSDFLMCEGGLFPSLWLESRGQAEAVEGGFECRNLSTDHQIWVCRNHI